MSLVDDLRNGGDWARLQAARAAHAATEGDEPGLVPVLLEVALTDDTEVRTAFGLNDDTEHIGDTAASSLMRVLERVDGIDPRVRAAVTDPGADDDRVGRLLHHLGPRYEPLRRELAASPEGRLRLRALKADPDRTADVSMRFLSDPSPAVRAEAVLRVPKGLDVEVLQRVLATDAAAEVRRAAASCLVFTPAGSAPFLAALRVETDLLTKGRLLSGLQRRIQEPGVLPAVVGLLADEPLLQQWTSSVLYNLADAGVAAAFASRILVEDDYQVLSSMLRYQHLMAYVPELRGLLERMLRNTDRDGHVFHLTRALAKPDGRPVAVDPAAGLDSGQRDRLLREVVGWAVAALEPYSPDEAADLRRWLASPPGDLRQTMDEGSGWPWRQRVGTRRPAGRLSRPGSHTCLPPPRSGPASNRCHRVRCATCFWKASRW
ncbi:hypothetical protein [Phytohabitans rumicis]|uniref:Uncharacterized protein n=1 Tax=Phytohabitans rumicis TaxID=1076125 RepID=A0A6V8L7L2_9ACTN|nr:hypothetical protein [Phytohabitans rumicis]GFJ88645.1 hypothetical protein Prum_022870 [Phytohabitans rumicis]